MFFLWSVFVTRSVVTLGFRQLFGHLKCVFSVQLALFYSATEPIFVWPDACK